MARNFFGVERGVRIYQENSDTVYIEYLFGTVLPGSDSYTNDAPIGSFYIYQNGASSAFYQKKADTDAPSDWELNGSASAVVGKWRDPVKVVTNDTVAVGTRDLTANPFADDEGTLITAASFVVGDLVIADADGTPVLREVTAVSSPNVTFANYTPALSTNDTFVTENYLPDSPGSQEGRAIVNYNGSTIVKLGDIDWNFANGINMASPYTPVNGSVSSSDTVQSAIEKLDANQQDLITLSGVAQGAVDLGTLTGDIVPDNSTIKQAIQSLETELVDTRQNVDDLITLSGVAENSTTYGVFSGDTLADSQNSKQLFQRIEDLLEQMRGVQVTGLTTLATVDQVPTASVKAVKWLVEVFEEATPANRQAIEVFALNNGTVSDDNKSSILKVGANFNFQTSVDVSGGNMRLRASSTTAGVTVTARRIEVVKTLLS